MGIYDKEGAWLIPDTKKVRPEVVRAPVEITEGLQKFIEDLGRVVPTLGGEWITGPVRSRDGSIDLSAGTTLYWRPEEFSRQALPATGVVWMVRKGISQIHQAFPSQFPGDWELTKSEWEALLEAFTERGDKGLRRRLFEAAGKEGEGV